MNHKFVYTTVMFNCSSAHQHILMYLLMDRAMNDCSWTPLWCQQNFDSFNQKNEDNVQGALRPVF
jgi:hypothetical protein